jgi:hypothetical protein
VVVVLGGCTKSGDARWKCQNGKEVVHVRIEWELEEGQSRCHQSGRDSGDGDRPRPSLHFGSRSGVACRFGVEIFFLPLRSVEGSVGGTHCSRLAVPWLHGRYRMEPGFSFPLCTTLPSIFAFPASAGGPDRGAVANPCQDAGGMPRRWTLVRNRLSGGSLPSSFAIGIFLPRHICQLEALFLNCQVSHFPSNTPNHIQAGWGFPCQYGNPSLSTTDISFARGLEARCSRT